MAANNFTGAIDNNWGTAGNWSSGAVPTASDGNVATFTALSPNCTVNASARVCNAIDFTNYTNTITMTNQITVSGAITLGAAMVIAGSGALIANTTATLTSNGKTWPNTLTFQGTSQTFTLGDNWTVSGNVASAGSLPTVNGNTLNISGNLTPGVNMGSGTTNFVLNGTGTWNGAFNIQNNLTINTAGTITLGANTRFITKTFTYTAGTVITTGNTMVCNAGNAGTWNCAGITWNNFTIGTSNSTITLTADMYISGTLSTGASTDTAFAGAYKIYISGSISNSSSAASYVTSAGFLGFEFTGTGTINCQGTFRPHININTAGTITFQSGVTFTYNTGTFTYTTGTVVTTGMTFQCNATTTLNTNGIVWNQVNLTGSGTITLSSNMSCANLVLSGTTATTTINGNTISASGNLIHPNLTTGIYTGTTIVELTGSGNITMAVGATGSNRLAIVVASSGTYTMTGTFRHITKSLTFNSGTLDMTAATYAFQGTLTVNATGLHIFLLQLFFAGSTINGTQDFTIDDLYISVVGITHTFKNGRTYTITTAFRCADANLDYASPITLQSDSPGNQANIILQNNGTATQDITFVNATDINSSGGQTIWSYKGALSNATNWGNYTATSLQTASPIMT